MEIRRATEQVSARVKDEVTRQGHSQIKLGKVLGLSQSAISNRLNGHTPFDIDELQVVADFLQIPLASLIEPNTTAATA